MRNRNRQVWYRDPKHVLRDEPLPNVRSAETIAWLEGAKRKAAERRRRLDAIRAERGPIKTDALDATLAKISKLPERHS